MIQITLKIDGMQCGMCEAHINDAVRQAFKVKKVSSSRSKGETVIIAEEAIDENTLRNTISAAGYTVKSCQSAPYEKKGLFSTFRK